MSRPTRYAFADFELDADARVLTRGGTPVRIGGRAFDLLLLLIHHSGEPVSKQALIRAIWPNVTVEDNNLTTQVATLRRVLGETRQRPFIGTESGRGYRWLMPVQPAGMDHGRAEPENGLTGLPRPPRMIGRDGLLETAAARLGARRLLAFVGPGGAGKSALAVAAAARAAPRPVFVDLASASGQGAAGRISSAFGVAPALDVIASAISALRAAPNGILLVLDGFEAAPPDAHEVTMALLRSCPALRILVTSREIPGLEGEALIRVGGLLCPEGDALTPEDAQSPALQLLAEAARDAGTVVDLDDGTVAAHAAAVCRRLDGLPLALLLAGRRLASWSLPELARRISQGSDLAGGVREWPQRHHSLRACFGWSFSRLSPHEQSVLTALTAFPESFDVAGAAALLEPGEGGPGDLLDCLSALSGKSLLEGDSSGAATRFRLLATVWRAARARLEESGRAAICDRRAREWLLARAAASRDAAERLAPEALAAAFGADLGNFSALMVQAIAGGDAATAVPLLAWSAPLAEATGRGQDWARRAVQVLGMPGAPGEAEFGRIRALAEGDPIGR